MGEPSSTSGNLTIDKERQAHLEPSRRFNRLILVVSQLWLLKFGGKTEEHPRLPCRF